MVLVDDRSVGTVYCFKLLLFVGETGRCSVFLLTGCETAVVN